MSDYTLSESIYLMPTPKGAYYAAASPEPEPARAVLQGLMSRDSTRTVTANEIAEWTGAADSLALLYRMERINWVTGREESLSLEVRNLEADMPALLAQISEEKRALLADTHGFQLAQTGFAHEVAEELAMFCAEVASLQNKYNNLIRGNFRLPSPAMAVVDVVGNSQLGVWPLFIGSNQFLLLVEGMPLFDRPAFMQVVWALCCRYGS